MDGSFARRSKYFSAFTSSEYQVEPFESVAELLARPPCDALILACDDDNTLSDLLDHISGTGTWYPVIGFGRPLNPVRCSQLFLQGLVGYLPTPFDHHDLTALLEGAGEQLRAVVDLHREVEEARRKLKALTAREAQVLEAVQAGLTTRRIADHLGISSRTVEVHRANLMRKMGTKTISAAVRMSVQAQTKMLS